MSTSPPRQHDSGGRDQPGDRKGDPGRRIPNHPQDTTPGGEARNDTGEDNQSQQGDRPADDYIRR